MERRNLAETWARTLVTSLAYEHRIPVKIPIGAIPSPRLITFAVELRDPTKLNKVTGLGEEVALRLNVQSCRVFRDRGQVIFEVPLPVDLCSTLRVEKLQLKGGLWVTLGMTSRMTPVHCRLNSPSIAPILVAGRTGAGKTEAIRLMLWELLSNNSPDDLGLVLYDPKSKFEDLEYSSHLSIPILRSPEQTIAGMGWLLNELSGRMGNDNHCKRILFVVDEMIELMSLDGSMGEGIGRLASLGREKGIHIVMATQRPDKKHLNRIGSANVGLRVVGNVADTVEAKLATGLAGTGAHLLGDKGDMLAVLAGTCHRIQTALIPMGGLRDLPMADKPPAPTYAMDDFKRLLSGDFEEATFPFTQREMAIALTGIGILKLKAKLQMGQDRATRLRNYTKGILGELSTLGYEIR